MGKCGLQALTAAHLTFMANLDIALIILKRSDTIEKSRWRLPSTRRTLDPIAAEPLIFRALREWRSNRVSPALIEAKLSLDGKIQTPAIRIANQVDRSGVFLLQFVDHGVKVRVTEEGCQEELGTPRRPSRHLTTLAFWKPMRILLNGRRQEGHDDLQLYLLQEYHLVLCDGSDNSQRKLSSSMQFFDLQADLL